MSSYSVFRHLAIGSAKPPPTSEQLATIEALLGAKLPASFVEFLRVGNGGYIEYVIDVPVGDGRVEQLSFSKIFSAAAERDGAETFLVELRSAREHTKVPPGVLPFARDGGGSIVYLDLSEEGGGRIVAFVTGRPEWTGSHRRQSSFITLAASFDQYVSKLRLDRELVLDQLQHDATSRSHVSATEEFLDIGLPEWRRDEELRMAVEAAHARVRGT